MKRRCPRLGHSVTFQYCRHCSDNELPCGKIIDCWWEHFDVVSYLKSDLSEDSFSALLNHEPEQKIGTLVALIAKAQNRVKKT
ncbi:MAG: hypothetical protein Q8P24_12785 [Desulfobacterales bacterium]|nr:hypothetical protein [Desulfobacterales bacterium]